MDPVAVETIIRLVKEAGSDAELVGDVLHVYPKDAPAVSYVLPPGGLRRRLVIQIGKRCGVPSRAFWSPPEDAAAKSEPSAGGGRAAE